MKPEQIEFKGQRVDNEEWVYGWFIKYEKTPFILPLKPKNQFINAFTKVIPETVGQYIGEKDIKGVKIYFQDLVKAWIYGDEEPQILQILYENCGFIIDYEDSESDCVLVGNFVGQLEIIGNIHDNPEL